MVKTGFILSPFINSAPALVALQAGRVEPLPVVRSLRLVHEDSALAQQFQPRWGYRLRELPAPTPEMRAAALAFSEGHDFDAEISGALSEYADVASPPPTRVHSQLSAGERFQMDRTTFVLVHAPGEMGWDLAPGHTRVHGRFAMRPNSWDPGRTDGAEFRVEFSAPGNPAPAVLLDRLLRPGEKPAIENPPDRGVQDFDLALPPEAGTAGGKLILRALPGPGGVANYDFTGWGDVKIE